MATTEGRAKFGRGHLFVLAAATLWSLSGVVTKGLDLPPLVIAFYRSLFAGLVLLPLVKPSRWVFRPAMLPSSLIFGAMIGLYIAAIKATTAANAIFLQCTATLWLIPASAILLRERPDRRAVQGISLAMVGVLAIVLWGYDGRSGEGLGILLALASGVAYAGVVLLFRGLRALDPLWLSAVSNLGGALTLGLWMLATQDHIPIPDRSTMLVLLLFGLIQMAIPYTLFARGLRDVTAPEAGLIGLLEPVLNPIWVFLVHDERPATATLVGGAFLLAGVALRYRPERRVIPEPTAEPDQV